MTTREFIEAFVKGTLEKKTKNGNWSVIVWGNMDVLVYTTSIREKGEWISGQGYQYATYNESERIAYKLSDGSVLSNANQLKYVGRRFAWGNEVHRRGTESDEQRWLVLAGAVPIPFTLFDETSTDVRDFSWIVKPVPEEFTVIEPPRYKGDEQRTIHRHFSGACLFEIEKNKTEKDTYLFDIDRQEITENKLFNPFVTKLPHRVETIKEAYDLLMPDEVKKAISNGIEVKRQGEFFFIRHSDDCPVKIELTDEEKQILRYRPSKMGFELSGTDRLRWVDDDTALYPENTPLTTPDMVEYQNAALKYKAAFEKLNRITAHSGTLGKSSTGSHKVEKFVQNKNITYASGTVKQERRQHGDLILSGWYKVVPNTGVLSWTITGDID